jgi:hypothetical protein
MIENKWGAEPWVNAPKVQEIIDEPIATSLSASLADPSEVIIPGPRLSMIEEEIINHEVKDQPVFQQVLIENDGWSSEKSISAIFYSHKTRVEDLISQVSIELNIAHSKKYDAVQAELTAALILEAQKELSEFLADAELISKERKAEVERVEAEQYFLYKNKREGLGGESKITDTALNRMVAKDKLVLMAKKEQYEAESDFSKYKNLFGMLKDAHVFFRGLSKGKNDWT